MVRGACVLYGQAVSSGQRPYQMWIEPLRLLALSTDLSDFEAGVLKEVVPELEKTLQRAIPDPPRLSRESAQKRLTATVTELLRKQTQPLVILLEDLQWIAGGLPVLQWLSELIGELPIMVVGNYRDDERPDLPKQVPNMRLIKLERLSAQAIAELSISMLGESGGRPEVVELLQHETEGNVFFLVEVVRALAQEAVSSR
jgi:predicted ATPase